MPKVHVVVFYSVIGKKKRIENKFGLISNKLFDIYIKTHKEANLIKEKLKDVLFSFERPTISLSFILILKMVSIG